MSSKLQFKHIDTILNDYDVFLIDIWGVIIEGTLIYPGVVEKINELSKTKTVYIVSNAPRDRKTLYDIVSSWGLNTTPEQLFCSGEIARQILRKLENPLIYHLEAEKQNFIINDITHRLTKNINEAEVLLLTIFREQGQDLTEFDNILEIAAQRKILTICANPDTTIPNLGSIRYCPGYFAEKVEKLGGNVIYTGKPYKEIYENILLTVPNIEKSRIIMIGDTFETDILGANTVGIHSGLTFTGNANKFHEAYNNLSDKLMHLEISAKNAGVMPNFVISLVKNDFK